MNYNYYPNMYNIPAQNPQYSNIQPQRQSQIQPQVPQYPNVQSQNQSPFSQQVQSQYNKNMIWVQGIEGAKSYWVAPGNAVLLMDSESQTFYIKSAGLDGKPNSLEIFDYTQRVENSQDDTIKTKENNTAPESIDMSQYVTKDEVRAIIKEMSNTSSEEFKNEPKEEVNRDDKSTVREIWK